MLFRSGQKKNAIREINGNLQELAVRTRANDWLAEKCRKENLDRIGFLQQNALEKMVVLKKPNATPEEIEKAAQKAGENNVFVISEKRIKAAIRLNPIRIILAGGCAMLAAMLITRITSDVGGIIGDFKLSYNSLAQTILLALGTLAKLSATLLTLGMLLCA